MSLCLAASKWHMGKNEEEMIEYLNLTEQLRFVRYVVKRCLCYFNAPHDRRSILQEMVPRLHGSSVLETLPLNIYLSDRVPRVLESLLERFA